MTKITLEFDSYNELLRFCDGMAGKPIRKSRNIDLSAPPIKINNAPLRLRKGRKLKYETYLGMKIKDKITQLAHLPKKTILKEIMEKMPKKSAKIRRRVWGNIMANVGRR